MARLGKVIGYLGKGIAKTGVGAIRNANKVKKAASKEIEVLLKAGPKQASGVSKTDKTLNQAAKEAQQAKLTRQHQAKIDRLQGKIDEAKFAKKEGLKTVGKRAAVSAGIVGYGALNQAQKQSMQKRITELEGKTKTATKVNSPASTSTTPSEEKKQESTQNNENNTQQSTTQRSGNDSSSRSTSYSSRSTSYSSSSQPRVRVRSSAGGSSSSSGYVPRVGVKPVRKSSENVKAKKTGKTDRYKIKQEERTKRTKIRQEEMTKRQLNRQNKKTERQVNRQNRKANRRNK